MSFWRGSRRGEAGGGEEEGEEEGGSTKYKVRPSSLAHHFSFSRLLITVFLPFECFQHTKKASPENKRNIALIFK